MFYESFRKAIYLEMSCNNVNMYAVAQKDK